MSGESERERDLAKVFPTESESGNFLKPRPFFSTNFSLLHTSWLTILGTEGSYKLCLITVFKNSENRTLSITWGAFTNVMNPSSK